MTRTIRHRHSRAGRTRVPYGQNDGGDLTLLWLIFRKERQKSEAACRRKHLIGVAIDLYIAPDLQDPAIGADQHRRTNNALEGPAIHRFFTPGAIGLQHPMLFIRNKRNREL